MKNVGCEFVKPTTAIIFSFSIFNDCYISWVLVDAYSNDAIILRTGFSMGIYATLSVKVNHCKEVEAGFENPAVSYFLEVGW